MDVDRIQNPDIDYIAFKVLFSWFVLITKGYYCNYSAVE
jgi:hypothetical protein